MGVAKFTNHTVVVFYAIGIFVSLYRPVIVLTVYCSRRNVNLPVFGNRIDGYRNSKRMAINGMVKRLCKEEDVGYVDLWDSFVGKEEMYLRDGLHLSGKGAAVFAEGLSGAVASGLGKVRNLN